MRKIKLIPDMVNISQGQLYLEFDVTTNKKGQKYLSVNRVRDIFNYKATILNYY